MDDIKRESESKRAAERLESAEKARMKRKQWWRDNGRWFILAAIIVVLVGEASFIVTADKGITIITSGVLFAVSGICFYLQKRTSAKIWTYIGVLLCLMAVLAIAVLSIMEGSGPGLHYKP